MRVVCLLGLLGLATAYHPAVVDHGTTNLMNSSSVWAGGLQWEQKGHKPDRHFKTGAYGLSFFGECADGDPSGVYITGSFVGDMSLSEWLGDTRPSAQLDLVSAGGNDIFVARVNINAEKATMPQWAVRAGGEGNDAGAAVATVLKTNVVIVGGSFEGSASFPASGNAHQERKGKEDPWHAKQKTPMLRLKSHGFSDGFVAAYDPAGAVLWALRIGGTGEDTVSSVATTESQESVFVGGWFTGHGEFDTMISGESAAGSRPPDPSKMGRSRGGHDMFVARYAVHNGFVVWMRTFGSEHGDAVVSLAAHSGFVVITGYISGDVLFGGREGDRPSFVNSELARCISTGVTRPVVVKLNATDGAVKWATLVKQDGYDDKEALTSEAEEACATAAKKAEAKRLGRPFLATAAAPASKETTAPASKATTSFLESGAGQKTPKMFSFGQCRVDGIVSLSPMEWFDQCAPGHPNELLSAPKSAIPPSCKRKLAPGFGMGVTIDSCSGDVFVTGVQSKPMQSENPLRKSDQVIKSWRHEGFVAAFSKDGIKRGYSQVSVSGGDKRMQYASMGVSIAAGCDESSTDESSKSPVISVAVNVQWDVSQADLHKDAKVQIGGVSVPHALGDSSFVVRLTPNTETGTDGGEDWFKLADTKSTSVFERPDDPKRQPFVAKHVNAIAQRSGVVNSAIAVGSLMQVNAGAAKTGGLNTVRLLAEPLPPVENFGEDGECKWCLDPNEEGRCATFFVANHSYLAATPAGVLKRVVKETTLTFTAQYNKERSAVAAGALLRELAIRDGCIKVGKDKTDEASKEACRKWAKFKTDRNSNPGENELKANQDFEHTFGVMRNREVSMAELLKVDMWCWRTYVPESYAPVAFDENCVEEFKERGNGECQWITDPTTDAKTCQQKLVKDYVRTITQPQGAGIKCKTGSGIMVKDDNGKQKFIPCETETSCGAIDCEFETFPGKSECRLNDDGTSCFRDTFDVVGKVLRYHGGRHGGKDCPPRDTQLHAETQSCLKCDENTCVAPDETCPLPPPKECKEKLVEKKQECKPAAPQGEGKADKPQSEVKCKADPTEGAAQRMKDWAGWCGCSSPSGKIMTKVGCYSTKFHNAFSLRGGVLFPGCSWVGDGGSGGYCAPALTTSDIILERRKKTKPEALKMEKKETAVFDALSQGAKAALVADASGICKREVKMQWQIAQQGSPVKCKHVDLNFDLKLTKTEPCKCPEPDQDCKQTEESSMGECSKDTVTESENFGRCRQDKIMTVVHTQSQSGKGSECEKEEGPQPEREFVYDKCNCYNDKEPPCFGAKACPDSPTARHCFGSAEKGMLMAVRGKYFPEKTGWQNDKAILAKFKEMCQDEAPSPSPPPTPSPSPTPPPPPPAPAPEPVVNVCEGRNDPLKAPQFEALWCKCSRSLKKTDKDGCAQKVNLKGDKACEWSEAGSCDVKQPVPIPIPIPIPDPIPIPIPIPIPDPVPPTPVDCAEDVAQCAVADCPCGLVDDECKQEVWDVVKHKPVAAHGGKACEHAVGAKLNPRTIDCPDSTHCPQVKDQDCEPETKTVKGECVKTEKPEGGCEQEVHEEVLEGFKTVKAGKGKECETKPGETISKPSEMCKCRDPGPAPSPPPTPTPDPDPEDCDYTTAPSEDECAPPSSSASFLQMVLKVKKATKCDASVYGTKGFCGCKIAKGAPENSPTGTVPTDKGECTGFSGPRAAVCGYNPKNKKCVQYKCPTKKLMPKHRNGGCAFAEHNDCLRCGCEWKLTGKKNECSGTPGGSNVDPPGPEPAEPTPPPTPSPSTATTTGGSSDGTTTTTGGSSDSDGTTTTTGGSSDGTTTTTGGEPKPAPACKKKTYNMVDAIVKEHSGAGKPCPAVGFKEDVKEVACKCPPPPTPGKKPSPEDGKKSPVAAAGAAGAAVVADAIE